MGETMIYFPKPYDHESFYSIVARFHTHKGNITIQESCESLFGKGNKIVHIEFPTAIHDIVSKEPIASHYNVKYFITNHTTFPYYRIFLDESQSSSLMDELAYGDGIKHAAQLGLISGDVKLKENLFFCPLCAKEQKEQFGEAYWNRVHQVQGYKVCTKHLTILEEVPLKNRRSLISLSTYMKNWSQNIQLIEREDWRVKIAYEIEWLFNTSINMKPEFITKQYSERLKQKRYISYDGNTLKLQKLMEDILNFYSENVLKGLELNLNPENLKRWISSAVKGKYVHPLRHILLILFLCDTLQEFFKNDYEYCPFGKGPWKCINPVFNHDDAYCITNVEISHNQHTKRAVGLFKCDCDFHYLCDEPMEDKEFDIKNFKVKRIHQFGKAWDNTLIKMVKEKQTLNYMSQRLGVSTKKIKIEAKRLELDGYWSNKGLYVGKGKMENQRDYYKEIKEFYKKHPMATRKQIAKERSAAYRWLIKNDRMWFEENMPTTLPTGYRNRVDWSERDERLLRDIQQLLIEWDKHVEKPTRITETSIALKLLNKQSLYGKYRGHYPRTAKYVSLVVETFEQYYKRCVRRAIDVYGNTFTSVNQLIKAAQISYGAYYQIKGFVDENINIKS
ncbi:TnsD family Tn7-like transposition protein [Bacillus multifaciens]|uniref:TnsD family Tn7-like transposition protein n=1 Tax=Bacillus multifaciens TaxID=3068506 RepID=UPI0027413292|nr:TnsD family Tn7-like transposition protein [Bacillus sp. WLY-B-L8]MDP7981249.1 TnsD family Tn7-like transposition protein [Bacillus sp. WLY-B-L8]